MKRITILVVVLAVFTALPVLAEQKPRVELAILLDTSNSMDGLINQARSELWQVVNELTKATKDGQSPELRIALFEYGNDRLSAEGGHVRRVLSFTNDLDLVSEKLFALTTNGGSEFCGKVISDALDELKWSRSSDVLRLIFIAGNEPFNQGSWNFREVCTAASKRGLVVNTIHCGDHETGIREYWQEGARLAGGKYLSINHNKAIAHITAPQDDTIAKLNIKLNATYIAYGARGKEAQARQVAQDQNAQSISSSTVSKRTAAKSMANYVNIAWDLVDATEAQEVDVEKIDPEDLPEEMQSMTLKQRLQHIETKRTERTKVQAEIQRLVKERESYVAQKRKELSETGDETLDQAMIKAIHDLGSTVGLEFEGSQ